MDLVTRTRRLLESAKYLSLATVSTEEQPWSAVLQYAWLADPLRFLFGSAVRSRHSTDVSTRPQVAGSLFVAGGDLLAVDGAQFSGTCRELSPAEVAEHHATFYDAVLPDARDRAEWTLPVSLLVPPAPHRVYVVEVEQWWLVDTSTWVEDRIDRRVEVPLADLADL
ncbi:pyridoxamine 5'-phosphate oxidase family protein [Actinophytocola sp. NPDC049390]|uniref:pyridoxamine 5'-phosphate oxidase family protein n=1 Tax=Actinophytocola sp. NPDC049390 TaxID=3363894 RepID=UPI0037ABB495